MLVIYINRNEYFLSINFSNESIVSIGNFRLSMFKSNISSISLIKICLSIFFLLFNFFPISYNFRVSHNNSLFKIFY